jgi:hypothetical protein
MTNDVTLCWRLSPFVGHTSAGVDDEAGAARRNWNYSGLIEFSAAESIRHAHGSAGY